MGGYRNFRSARTAWAFRLGAMATAAAGQAAAASAPPLSAACAPAASGVSSDGCRCTAELFPGRSIAGFAGAADGSPQAGGAVFREGRLYGATNFGGPAGAGTIYELKPPVPPGLDWTRATIAVFNGAPDGGQLSSGLLLDSAGAFYGVAYQGGASNNGAVYKLTPPVAPASQWAKTVIYSFKGGTDGAKPVDGLVMDSSGALYGVLQGASGAVFRLTPPVAPATAWTNTILYAFQGKADGSGPRGPLSLRNGALYGVTHDLGDTGRGTAFRLAPPAANGGVWTKTILHRFPNVPNKFWSLPTSLVFDTSGAIYGATQQGGVFGQGVAFKLAPSIFPEWNYTALYSFKGQPDAANASGALMFDSSGALFGATAFGGAGGFGAIYRLTPPTATGGAWSEDVVFSFKGAADGVNPTSGLFFDTDGAMYGVAANGGAQGKGSVFRLKRPAADCQALATR